jgi:transposase
MPTALRCSTSRWAVIVQAAGLCAGLARPVRVVYEAGPTGMGWRASSPGAALGASSRPASKIPRASGERVKTDRRDAEHLVRLLLAGKLHAVRVPGPAQEALRDLVRAPPDNPRLTKRSPRSTAS